MKPLDEPAVRYTPGEWLYCVWTIISSHARVLASGHDTAVMRRETERVRAAVSAPCRRTERGNLR